ncbi:MAG TPA: hypothetical protein VH988_32900 [Thermoanaerobaculia bacterium]|jgi:photosystem II stability/assembly factor-like uncharacterized protein|nr:hypothetical protein [Thermoanaerobaculia bacterium]
MSATTRRVSLPLIFAILLGSNPVQAGTGVWTPVGPGTGWSSGIASITVHPGSPGTVWVGMPQGGLYRSSDRGVNWQWAGGPFVSWQTAGVSVVTADPSRPGALWAATQTGVFRTTDSGAHWVQLNGASYTAALNKASPNGLVTVPGVLYVVTFQRLLASTDGGRTWQILYDSAGNGSLVSFATHPAAPRVLYLSLSADPSSLLQSLDGGQTWATVTSCPPVVEQIVLSPTAAYVAVAGNAAGLLRSTDLGRTWRPVLGGTLSRQFDVLSVAVDPRASRTLYASGFFSGNAQDSGLWVSRNAGGSWTKAGPAAIGALRIDSAAGVLYGSTFGNRGGLQRSLNGGATWTTVLTPPSSESEAAQINFRPGDPTRAALAVGFTLYRSVNGAASWKLSSSLWGVYDVDLDPSDPNRLIAATQSSIYLSENAGQTWQRASSESLWYLELLTRVDTQTLLAGGAGIYRSGDNGRSWQTVLSGFPTSTDTGRWTQKIVVDPVHPSTVYALTFLANLELPHGPLAGYWPSILWKSTDSGKTWKKMTLNLRTFAVDALTSRLYGVRDRQLLASDDGGKTWKSIGRTPNDAYDLVIDPTDSNVLYTAPTLWRSRDRGATWTLVTDSWSPAVLTFDPRNPRTLYGADRWSVYMITVPD